MRRADAERWRISQVLPNALEGGCSKALADGAGNHENQGDQVDLLPAQVVAADAKGHLASSMRGGELGEASVQCVM